MKRLLNYFFKGLVFLAPLAITIYVCVVVFTSIDGWLGLPIPGVGFLVTVALITLFGFFASNLITRSVLSLLEEAVGRLPFVKLLYSSTKDLLNAFVGEKRRFETPVMVALTDDGGVKAFGFITQESLEALGVRDHVAVYLPQSYNFAGQVLVVPSARVTRLSASSSEVMTFIVSGGVSGHPHPRLPAEPPPAALPAPRDERGVPSP